MNKYVSGVCIVAAFMFCVTASALAGGSVGYVHVDSWDTAPSDAYELHRAGGQVGRLYQDMPVQNGDYIIPLKKGCVILEFNSHDCESFLVNSPTEVSCTRKDEGFWHSVYDKLNFFSPRYDLEETQGTTLRGEEIEIETDKNEMIKSREDKKKKLEDEKW